MPQYATEAALPLGRNVNTSVQIGDELWCSCQDPKLNDGFTTILGTPFNIGIVTGFHEVNGFTYIEFNHSIVGLNINTLSSTLGQCTVLFLSFKKDCSANISSLLGYYAEVKFVNDDYNNSNELFGINSQVAISSK